MTLKQNAPEKTGTSFRCVKIDCLPLVDPKITNQIFEN